MFDKLLAQLGHTLDSHQIPYAVIGGQAVLQHGVPRFTRDIDISLGVDSGAVESVLRVLVECGLQAIPPSPAEFVARTFILPAQHVATEMRVDFAFTFTPFERQAIERAAKISIAGYPVAYASVEDLIIHKLFAGRPRDIEDIRGVLARKQGQVDREYLRDWIQQFAQIEGKGHLTHQLEELLAESP